MSRREDAAAGVVAVEFCPQCGSLDVRAVEPGWFTVELDPARDPRDEERVEFACRECATTWV